MSHKHYSELNPQADFPKMEKKILDFWDQNKIFEKSLELRKNSPKYSFYDGPPFATGTPHYGHIVPSTIKDVIPRYWTMKGRYVERKWGWDCHGLPIENIAEKELGINQKKEILEFGVKKFNDFCRSKVLEYADEWKVVIRRLGRWVDMDNAYKTMDLSYMESVWWVFKELWDKGLIYEGHRSMHICTRCETTLSQSEVAEGYKLVKDLSATAKFQLDGKEDVFALSWTTTPWTLIGNVALAVNKEIKYILVEAKDKETGRLEKYILAKEAVDRTFKDRSYKIIKEIKGSELIGKKYKPLFPYYSDQNIDNADNGWKIYHADFVTTGEGTGIVHIAPAFGEDDMNLGQKEKLPFVQHVKMDGTIKEEAGEFAGLSVKSMDDNQKTDVEIIKYLASNNLLFAKEKYEHSYPHCWRCETPLINYATNSWFVNILKIKEEALKSAQEIKWFPHHIKSGRFGKWLEGARDWSISRQRFWASVLPIWRCNGFAEIKNQKSKIKNSNQKSKICSKIVVVGSVGELESLSGVKVTDLHKHTVDEVTFECSDCGGEMVRVPDVLDTWFDSGSMPYAELHYPFENQEKFDESFPADFIAEGSDQTRAWFYYLHILSNAIKKRSAFKQVIVGGIVLAQDGKKMSKRLKNYPDPMTMVEKYGADTLRFYLMSSPVVAAENLNFKESEMAEIHRGMFRMLWNTYYFFILYANIDNFSPPSSVIHAHPSVIHAHPFVIHAHPFVIPAKAGIQGDKKHLPSENMLDRWVLSELQVLISAVNKGMQAYDLAKTARLFPKFIDNLSNWYIRRSRKRFWKSENDSDKNQAYETLSFILVELSKLMAPFTPFISEEIYKNLTKQESVHLADFPEPNEKLIDKKLNKQMSQARLITESGLSIRNQLKIKVRQPLAEIEYTGEKLPLEMEEIVADELNVKKVIYAAKLSQDYSHKDDVALNTQISDDLKLEGEARELVRQIQQARKAADFEIADRITLSFPENPEFLQKILKMHGDYLKKEVLAVEINYTKPETCDYEGEAEINGAKTVFYLKIEKNF